MWREAVLCVLGCAVAVGARAGLTETETRWLKAGLPVLEHARRLGLPIDVVVQPQDAPGEAPLAMDFVDGRCKLVVSMRGNPQADAMLAQAPPALVPLAIETVVAHEVAHCWRHVNGSWKVLPAGFTEVADDAGDHAADARRDMRATRREEGFADLAALAWMLQRHPQHYEQVHAWLAQVRAHQPVSGSHHDTRAWVRLAADRQVFPVHESTFEQARAAWQQGLLLPD